MKLDRFDISDAIPLPLEHDYGIGIVGCGGIVNYAHLPAYRAHHLNVLACYDLDPAVAQRTAADHGIPTVSESLEALLANPDIAIVDIAVTPAAQEAIARQALSAGKHLLCQKPLATSVESGEQLVQLAAGRGLKLAVNQQMRWDAGIRVSKQLIEQGAIGTPVDARIEVSIQTPWTMWPWISASEQLEVMYHSIHYLDSIRYLFGDPVEVVAVHGRWPRQGEVGETRTQTILVYESDLRVLVDVQHHNWSDDAYARFRWLGTEGIITGTLGLLYDYPTGRVDTLRYQPNREPREWFDAELSTWWIPDAFIGPMASLMEAIGTGGEPLTSGRDNLGTLRLVRDAYRSASQRATSSMS